MMLLSSFTDPSPSVESLRKEQLRLQKQADKMLQQTGLLEVLSQYGDFESVGGSYAYSLMVYPDLDIDLINDHVTTKDLANVVASLVKNPHVRRVSTTNNVDFAPQPGRPKGYWLGLETPFEDDRWSIDCWLQKKEWVNAEDNPYPDLLKKLNDTQRDAILTIKYQLIFRGLYGKTFYSTDVYDAVAKDGVLTIDDFLAAHSS